MKKRFDFKLDNLFFQLWHKPLLYKISTDYEELSSFIICRLLLKTRMCLCYPLIKSPFFYVTNTFDTNDIQKELGINAKQHKLEEDEGGFSPHHFLIFFLFDHLLNLNYQLMSFSSSVYDYRIGVILSSELHHKNKRKLITVETCIINSDGDGLICIQITNYCIIPYQRPSSKQEVESSFSSRNKVAAVLDEDDIFMDIEDNDQKSSTSNTYTQLSHPPSHHYQQSNDESEDVSSSSKAQGVLMYSYQDVSIHGNIFYHPHRDSSEALLLTDSNRRQRQRGYQEYLPSTPSRYELYWQLLCNYKLSSSSTSSSSSSVSWYLYHVQEETMDRIIPVDLVAKVIIDINQEKDRAEDDEDEQQLFAVLQQDLLGVEFFTNFTAADNSTTKKDAETNNEQTIFIKDSKPTSVIFKKASSMLSDSNKKSNHSKDQQHDDAVNTQYNKSQGKKSDAMVAATIACTSSSLTTTSTPTTSTSRKRKR